MSARPLPDAYATLQVVPTADPDVVRAAYRALAARYHPDRSSEPEAAQRMVELNAAWQLVGDPVRREAYDLGRALEAAHREEAETREPAVNDDRERAPVGQDAPASVRRRRETVLDFGPYRGWSLPDLAREHPDYLDWLRRMPIGRPFAREIELLLASATVTSSGSSGGERARRRSGWLGRRA